jgi:DNA-binding IclR family transcriptional regulator
MAILTLDQQAQGVTVEEKSRRGIQSIEIGSKLLSELSRHLAPMALKDLSKAAGLSTGKAHPYLVSFLKVGFVQQDAASRYELGPLALQLGLTKLRRLDPVKEAAQFMTDLAESTGQSIALSVWGNFGPTIVRMEEPLEPLHVNLRTGTVMSIANTATGRLWAAYLPPKVVERHMNDELARLGTVGSREATITREEVQAHIAEIHAHGLSRSLNMPVPGINGLCAPVFDAEGHIVLGILAMGTAATFDASWDGPAAKALRACADEVSSRIGFRAAAA